MSKFLLTLALLVLGNLIPLTQTLVTITPTIDAVAIPQQLTETERADMIYLKKFFKSADRWGLYRKIKKMSRSDFEKLLVLHEKYNLKTEYLTYTKQLVKKKPKLKVRKQLNRHSYWQTEIRSFLIKNQVIEYKPTRGARLDQGGFRFQF